MIGTIAYATQSGLGLLARAFFRNKVVDRILILPHPRYQGHPEWYGDKGFYPENWDTFLEGLDCLLLLENAWNSWPIVEEAKRRGIRVVMIPMYEFTPFPLPVPVDLYLCPSKLDVRYYEKLPHKFLPIPVQVPWRLRKFARTFIHNAGHGGYRYRNGTPELVDAMKYVRSDARLLLRGQANEPQIQKLFRRIEKDPRIEITLGDVSDDELYHNGDVFVFPEKFNGLSLPLQEAYASGLLVMASDRFPMNDWLPKQPLIRVIAEEPEKIAVRFFKSVISPLDIAKKIDEWYNRDISAYSLAGRRWAEDHSWERLRPKYLEVLCP